MKRLFLIQLILILSCPLLAQDETFTDSRDKQTYKITKVGNQVWFAENLRYKAPGAVSSKPGENQYGLLYGWEIAQKACPAGWQVPNEDDWKALLTTLGGKYVAGGKMKSNSSLWKTPNKLNAMPGKFNAEPAGMISGEQPKLVSESALYWSSEAECTSGNSVILNFNAAFADKKVFPKTDLLAVRCIKKP